MGIRPVFYCIILSVTLLVSCARHSDTLVTNRLQELYDNERYFLFDELLRQKEDKLTNQDRYYFEYIRASVFPDDNAFLRCNKKIQRSYYKSFSPQQKHIFHELNKDFCQRTGRYHQALDHARIISGMQDLVLDSVSTADNNEDIRILEILTDFPAAEVNKIKNMQLNMYWDSYFWHIPVKIKDKYYNLVFDTGSGTSLVSMSVARETGMTVLPADLDVLGSTGKTMASRIGIADSFRLGDILFRHAVFRVLEDSLLTFYDGEYTINGLFGADMMSMMGEVTIFPDGRLIIPKEPGDYTLRNLAFENMQTIMCIGYNSDSIPVKFDTGSGTSRFMAPMYQEYQEVVMQNGQKTELVYGGIGGDQSFKKFNLYNLDSVEVEMNDTIVKLSNVIVHSSAIHVDPVEYYGVFGWDFLEKFASVTISFASNSILFNR